MHPPPVKTGYAQPPPPGPNVAYDIPLGSPLPKVVETPRAQQQLGRWSTGFCDCFTDVQSCCLVYWCPCIAFGQMSEIIDKGETSCCCNGSLYFCLCSVGLLSMAFGLPLSCQWIYSCSYRRKIKEGLGIASNPCHEACLHCWCEPCALSQEYREIKNRGYDLSLGWNGNHENIKTERVNERLVDAPVAPSMDR